MVFQGSAMQDVLAPIGNDSNPPGPLINRKKLLFIWIQFPKNVRIQMKFYNCMHTSKSPTTRKTRTHKNGAKPLTLQVSGQIDNTV